MLNEEQVKPVTPFLPIDGLRKQHVQDDHYGVDEHLAKRSFSPFLVTMIQKLNYSLVKEEKSEKEKFYANKRENHRTVSKASGDQRKQISCQKGSQQVADELLDELLAFFQDSNKGTSSQMKDRWNAILPYLKHYLEMDHKKNGVQLVNKIMPVLNKLMSSSSSGVLEFMDMVGGLDGNRGMNDQLKNISSLLLQMFENRGSLGKKELAKEDKEFVALSTRGWKAGDTMRSIEKEWVHWLDGQGFSGNEKEKFLRLASHLAVLSPSHAQDWLKKGLGDRSLHNLLRSPNGIDVLVNMLHRLSSLKDEDLKMIFSQGVGSQNGLDEKDCTRVGSLLHACKRSYEELVHSHIHGLGSKRSHDKHSDDRYNMQYYAAYMMMALNMLHAKLLKSNADEDERTEQLNAITLNSVKKQGEEMVKKYEEAVAAAHRPWWSYLIAAIATVIGAVVAAFTGGVGFAIATAVIGIVMMTPLPDKLVKAISSGIESSLEKQYESEGMSKKDAKKKAQSVANIIAKIVVAIIVVVVSVCAGGASVEDAGVNAAKSVTEDSGSLGTELSDFASQEASNEVTGSMEEASENMAREEAESNAVNEGEGSASQKSGGRRFSWSAKSGAKVGALGGVGYLANSGIVLDILTSDPEWAKKHKKLVEALNIIAEAVLTILTVVMGYSTLSGLASSASGGFGECLGNLFPKILKIGYTLQAGFGLAEAGNQANTAVQLSKKANIEESLGRLEKEMSLEKGVLDLSRESMQQNDQTTSAITKSFMGCMRNLMRVSGLEEDVASRVLRGR